MRSDALLTNFFESTPQCLQNNSIVKYEVLVPRIYVKLS